MSGSARLQRVALGLHAVLVVALAASLLSVNLPLAWRLGLALLVVLPLLATLPGLIGRRLTALRWLALVLVLYVGFGSVEVVATRTPAAAAVLLAALLELGLVLMLCQRTPPQVPDVQEEL